MKLSILLIIFGVLSSFLESVETKCHEGNYRVRRAVFDLIPSGGWRHKRIWTQNLGGAVAFHALMTSLCPNGFNTHKTKQRKLLF